MSRSRCRWSCWRSCSSDRSARWRWRTRGRGTAAGSARRRGAGRQDRPRSLIQPPWQGRGRGSPLPRLLISGRLRLEARAGGWASSVPVVRVDGVRIGLRLPVLVSASGSSRLRRRILARAFGGDGVGSGATIASGARGIGGRGSNCASALRGRRRVRQSARVDGCATARGSLDHPFDRRLRRLRESLQQLVQNGGGLPAGLALDHPLDAACAVSAADRAGPRARSRWCSFAPCCRHG